MISLRILCIQALIVAEFGQQQSYGQIPPDLRVQSDLVLVDALVTDGNGTPITGLNGSQFRLFEDGKEQVIRSFSSEDVPVSVGLVLDASRCMREIELLKEAAVRLVRAANSADEYFLIAFQARPKVAMPLTGDGARLLETINQIRPGGSTALFDAIHLAVNEMRHAHYPRKALLIVSDGVDNHSRYTERETKRLISEVDFAIYGINLWQPQRSGSRYVTERRDPATLETILPTTGGRVVAVRDWKKLASTTELISEEIRHEYVLGYAPSIEHHDGKTHRVKVSLEPSLGSKLKISHRTGYQAPLHERR